MSICTRNHTLDPELAALADQSGPLETITITVNARHLRIKNAARGLLTRWVAIIEELEPAQVEHMQTLLAERIKSVRGEHFIQFSF